MTKQEFEKKYDECNNLLGNITVCKEYIASLEAEIERLNRINANSVSKMELDTCRSLNDALREDNVRLRKELRILLNKTREKC